MPDRATITTAELAALLGVQKATLQDRIGTMRRDAGFPPPIPYSGGRRHSRDLVLAWINRTSPATPAPDTTLEQDVTACEAVLLRRAHAMLPAE
jgi:hypothetical protein